jgi:predicted Zn-dependent protease with MMP-like domain
MPKRRRGSRSAALRPRRRAVHRRFEELVEVALSRIPPPFDRGLDDLAVVVADEPDERQRRENELAPDETLYGLYEGIPRTAWGAGYAPVANTITLFRLPLEEDFPDPDDLADEVRATVMHELAHHLGIDDRRLGELGVD